MSSDTTMNWLRPVIGLVSQPASAPNASAARQCMCLKERFIAYRILRPAARRSCNEMFALDYVRPKQVPMPSPARPPKPDKEPVFQHPPVLIHVSAAARLVPRGGGCVVLHGRRRLARRPRPAGEARPARVDPRQINGT